MPKKKGSSTFYARRNMTKEFYTGRNMTKEAASELVEQYGTVTAAAKAIQPRCRDPRYPDRTPTVNAIRKWIRDAIEGLSVGQRPQNRVIDPVRERIVNQILNVIDEAGIPLDSLDHDNPVTTPKLKSGFHEVVTKDKDGKPHITKARSKSVVVTLNPQFKGPEWPVMQPAKPVAIKTTVRPRPKRTAKTIVVLSDLQIGFIRDIENLSNLVPIHDERAIDVALQIVADLQPEQLGYVGDFLDLSEMSRWLQLEEFHRTTQPAIEAGYRILARFEAAAGPRKDRQPTQFVGGNHDRRLREYIQKNARAAFHLRPAMETPKSWPDLTVPHLLRFDELGVEYVGEYPGGEWWITDSLVVRHNPEGPNSYVGSVIAGHTHRIRRDDFSRRTPNGPMFATLYEIGCLCRLDKYSDRKSLMATSVPSNRGFVQNWRQGFAVVSVAPDGSHSVELIDYVGPGRAIFRGKEYRSEIKAV